MLNQLPEPEDPLAETEPTSLLGRIVQRKLAEIPGIRDLDPAGPPVHSLQEKIRRHPGMPVRVIAECKKASPSSGLLRSDYHPAVIASEYAALGASAISVLTDREFFQGDLGHLELARTCGLPILRKDFIISPQQIFESRRAGADAFLLIVRLLDLPRLTDFLEIGRSLGMDALVETHNEREVEIALQAGADIIGINHRDLDTLVMDLSLTERLAPQIRRSHPKTVIVAESGVESHEGRSRVDPHADAVLIGTALMKAASVKEVWTKIFA